MAPLGPKDWDNVFDGESGQLAMACPPPANEIFVAAQLAHTPLDMVCLTEATTLEGCWPILCWSTPMGRILTSQQAQLLEKAYVRAGGHSWVMGAQPARKTLCGQFVMQPMPGLLAD